MNGGRDGRSKPRNGDATLRLNEKWLRRRMHLFVRFVPLCLVVMLPLLGWTAYRAISGASTDVLEWLPGDSVEVSNLSWFDNHFGSDQVLVISWDGAVIDDPSLAAVEKTIRKLRTNSGERLFSRVVSGTDVKSYLVGSMRVDRAEVLNRLDGWLSGPGEATAIVAVISKTGSLELPEALDRVKSIAIEETGLAEGDIRMAGTTMDGVAVDIASRKQTLVLGGIAIVMAILVAIFALGGLLQALPILVSALTSMLASLAAMFWLDLPVDGFSVIVPVLGFALTASATLHLHGYRDPDSSGVSAMCAALMRGAWPTSIALLTTAVGFACLGFSGTLPIQRFAIASSVSVIIVALVTGLLWPALTVALPNWKHASARRFSSGHLGALVVAKKRLIFLVSGILAVTAAAGLPRLDAAFGIDRLLAADHPLIEDYHWFEDNLGNVVPVEIVVRFKPDIANPSQTFLERADLIGQARKALQTIPGVAGAFSVDTFMPSEAMLLEGNDEMRLQRKIAGVKKRATGFALLSFEDNGDELWRISARVSAFGGLDFDYLDKTLGDSVRKSLRGHPDLAEVQVLGGLPMVAKAQQQLLRDLLFSFGLALIVLSILFALIFKSIHSGFLLLIPNVLPVTMVFGLLGWFHSPIDIGLVMTASVALGLAVDDSSHLLIAFRRAMQKGLSTNHAAAHAMEQVAPAAIRTSLVCGIPMLVFSMSAFLPAARFGTVIAALIAVALVVDLILLPAMLANFAIKK